MRFIQSKEALRFDYYLDFAGVCTVGYGSTPIGQTPNNPGCPVGTTIPQSDVDRLFAADVGTFEQVVTSAVTVPLQQHEFDALVSLSFNIGGGNFGGSTTLRELNAGNRILAADAILLWDKAEDPITRQLVQLPGLVIRRQEERDIFLTGQFPP